MSGCGSGSVWTHTSESKFAVRFLISLCQMKVKPHRGCKLILVHLKMANVVTKAIRRKRKSYVGCDRRERNSLVA